MTKYSKKEIERFRKTMLVDFDGVLHTLRNGYRTINGKPILKSKAALQELQQAGYHIIVLTARPVSEHGHIKRWMNKHYGSAIMKDIEVTNVKRPAMYLIDDRALRFTHWTDILNHLR